MADGDKVSWGKILGPLLREPYNHRSPSDLENYTFAQIHSLLLQRDETAPEGTDKASFLNSEPPPAEAPEGERRAHFLQWCAAVGIRESVAVVEWEKKLARDREKK